MNKEQLADYLQQYPGYYEERTVAQVHQVTRATVRAAFAILFERGRAMSVYGYRTRRWQVL